jgi:hypothetical protein
VRKKNWKRPTSEERAEHVRTLTRLGECILDRPCPIPVWFVLLTGFDDDALPLAIQL